MPKSSGSFSGKISNQAMVFVNDVANHEVGLIEVRGRQKSSDAHWNDAKITYWATADLVAGNGTQKGYFRNEHADGDADWGTFEAKLTTSGNDVRMEGTWSFTGGTGKFKGVSGNGTFKGRMLSPTEVEDTWEGSYQLASTARA